MPFTHAAGGHIQLKARIQYPEGTGANLEFAFEMDQKCLPSGYTPA